MALDLGISRGFFTMTEASDLLDRWHRAIHLFNSQDFYACHDVLEDMWHDAPLSDRNFYQGILQIAVGCYHAQNRNHFGAMALIGAGMANLRPYQPLYYGLDTTLLIQESQQIWHNLSQGIFPDRLPTLTFPLAPHTA
jgi:predicted metal-dependent hydrolase